MKISAGRDLAGYGAVLNETFLGGASWRFQDVGWDSFHVKVGWKILTQNFKIKRNPCLCAAVLTCQWQFFLGALLIVCDARCLGRTSHMSLPDLLTLIRPGVNLLHLSRCLCVFLCFFFGSYLFLSHCFAPHSYALYALTSLPSKFADYSYDWHSDIHTRLEKQRWLADFFASTKHRSRFESYDETPEIPNERRNLRAVFTSSWWMVVDFFPPICIFHQFGRVTSLHLFFFTGFRWLVHGWISFQKQVLQVQKRDFTTIFTNIPFGSRNHHKKSSIQGNHLESPKPTMYKWLFQSIGWWFLIFA